MLPTRRSLAALFAAPIVLLSLSATAASAQPVIIGPAADRQLRWILERRWTAGGDDDEFLQIDNLWGQDLAPGKGGTLYVVDRVANRVVQYDAQGKVVRTFGRAGAGPGEMNGPFSVSLGADDAIHVYDSEKRAFVNFTPDGEVLPERRRPPRLRTALQLTDGLVIGESQTGDTLRLVLVEADSSRNILRSVVLLPARSTPPVCRITDYPARPIFAPTLTWAMERTTVVSTADAFSISIHSDGKMVRLLTRDRQRRSSTTALARKHLGPGQTMQLLGMRPCTIPAEMILKVAEVAKEIPAYQALAIAPDRRIWATRFVVRGEEGVADIYDLEKGYEGSVRLGAARPVAFLSTGDLVSIEGEWGDAVRLVVYGVRRDRE